jgi:CPA1 family monovalent cation:H+ antiporter
MDPFVIIAGIVTLTAVLAVGNHRFFRLPDTIGVMAMAQVLSLGLIVVGTVFPGSLNAFCHVVAEFDFSYFVLGIALAFLIFAGAFSSDTRALKRERVSILVFATFGILLSTVIIGGLTYWVFKLIGLEISCLHSLLFGALISPTDPIAVIAILKKAGAPPNLEADIAGESL